MNIFTSLRSSLGIAACGIAIMLSAASSLPAQTSALTPEEKAVLAPLQAVLDGIGKHDQALIREQLLPGGMVTLVRNDQIVQMHFDAFVDHIHPGTDQFEERIYNPLIRIDDDIAIIWAPYDFFLNGKVDHCGTDTAHLVRRNGRWLIASIGDNSRKTCPAR